MLRKTPPPSDDEMTHRLRASLRQKRSWSWKSLAVLLVVLLSVGALLVWLFYPESKPPPIVLVAVDGFALPGEPLLLRARVEPAHPPEGKLELGGFELS